MLYKRLEKRAKDIKWRMEHGEKEEDSWRKQRRTGEKRKGKVGRGRTLGHERAEKRNLIQ